MIVSTLITRLPCFPHLSLLKPIHNGRVLITTLAPSCSGHLQYYDYIAFLHEFYRLVQV